MCRPHMLFLCLHAVCSPTKLFGKSMKVFHVREKLFVKKCYLKKRVKHCNCVRKSVRVEASKQHSFDERPCRGIPYKCGEMNLNFFSRDVALFRVISGVIDLINPRSGQTH